MGFHLCHTLIWFAVVWPYNSGDMSLVDPEFSHEERWMHRESLKDNALDEPCVRVRPTSRDLVKRFHAILPFFDKDHSNAEFLRKYRGTIYGMSEGEDLLDKEAAFYAAVLTPLVFLQNYRDTWCLLERFHRALRLYQISHPTEKRSALKLLQNFRAVNQKVRKFISELPGPMSKSMSSPSADFDDGELHDTKNIRFLKELVKNLG